MGVEADLADLAAKLNTGLAGFPASVQTFDVDGDHVTAHGSRPSLEALGVPVTPV